MLHILERVRVDPTIQWGVGPVLGPPQPLHLAPQLSKTQQQGWGNLLGTTRESRVNPPALLCRLRRSPQLGNSAGGNLLGTTREAVAGTVTDAHGVDANSVGANSAQPHGLITVPNGYPSP